VTGPIVELGKLMTLDIATSLLGFGFMLACLISLAKQLGEARASTADIAESTARQAFAKSNSRVFPEGNTRSSGSPR
jgi:hypothetical protein